MILRIIQRCSSENFFEQRLENVGFLTRLHECLGVYRVQKFSAVVLRGSHRLHCSSFIGLTNFRARILQSLPILFGRFLNIAIVEYTPKLYSNYKGPYGRHDQGRPRA